MKLFVLIKDCGDGSFYPQFILDTRVMEEILTLAQDRAWHYDNGFGCDGDGFHYKVINVPEGSTPESLGITVFSAADLEEWKKDYL